MSITFDSGCIECHLRRNLQTARSLGTEAQATEFAHRLMQLYLSAPAGAASPWFGPGTNDLYAELYGLSDDRYRQEKLASNRFVLERLDAIRAQVAQAPDRVYAALQFAVLGNYIDFAALQGEVSFDALDDMLRQAAGMQLDHTVYKSLCSDLENGKNMLYLTDNAGEIGFDRVLAEEILARYPHLAITFCVRGANAANDATREDAAAVGIEFPVIDNGNRVAGTQLDLLGAEAKQALEHAEVILAKGQGNAETMLGCGYNVYYAFLVKCPRFMKLFERPKLTPMLVRERSQT